MPRPPWKSEHGVEAVLSQWLASSIVKPCFCTDETLPGMGGTYAPVPPLATGIRQALGARGIERLYSHQTRAIEAALAGRHVVVATPTASGKSLCFHLPVLQALSEDPNARALYLFPTKALARDQEAAFRDLMGASGVAAGAAVYDGDTPGDARRAARERARVILTNPDMLHTGILPHHALVGPHAAEPALRRRRRDPHVPRGLRVARGERPAAPRAHRPLPRVRPEDPRGHGHDRQPARARRAPLRRPGRTTWSSSATAGPPAAIGAFFSSTRPSSIRSWGSARAT